MQRILLFISLVLTLSGQRASAQTAMYVCLPDVCEAYDIHNTQSVDFVPGGFIIGAFPPYDVQTVDSIVFVRPSISNLRNRGWWGNVADGELRYFFRFVDPKERFDYEACFYIEVEGERCTSASCMIVTNNDIEAKELSDFLLLEGDSNDSYIYIKQTQTGPRMCEEWGLGYSGILPAVCRPVIQGCQVEVSLTNFLNNRPIEEVKTIVEAWVHQPPVVVCPQPE